MGLLPEITERDAPPEIAAIYDEIRRFTQLPLVNLIYRHLATVPGALLWAWGLLRPAFADGSLEAAAGRIQAAVSLPHVEPVSPDRLDAADLSAADREQVGHVIAAYNRGNSLNLVGLTAVRLALDSPPRLRATRPEPVTAPVYLPDIPPIRRLGDLDPDLAAKVNRLAELHGVGAAGVIPSLYLHLANWPSFLALVAERVMPLLKDGTVARAGQQAVTFARAEAENLLSGLSGSCAASPTTDAEALRRVLDTFTGRAIPEMMCLGLAMSRAVDPGRP